MVPVCAKPGPSNPFDVLMYRLAFMLLPCLPRVHPNVVTAASCGVGLLASVLLARDSFGAAALAFVLSYFLDCLDGCLARETNQTTAEGDVFDHLTDALVWTAFYVMLVFKSRSPCLALGLLVLGATGTLHVLFQQQLMEGSTDSAPLMVGLAQYVRVRDPYAAADRLRWLGGGTTVLAFAGSALLVGMVRKTV